MLDMPELTPTGLRLACRRSAFSGSNDTIDLRRSNDLVKLTCAGEVDESIRVESPPLSRSLKKGNLC